MKKVFIDCGFYDGKATSKFKKSPTYDSDFVLYGFEANEKKGSRGLGVILFKKAVWIEDGEIEFYTSKRRRGRANSLFTNMSARREKKSTVPCIDLSKWIMDNFDKNDFIVLKMDIEGGEYEVLSKMMEDKSLDYVNVLYMEWHAKRRPDLEEEYKLSINKAVKNYKGLEYNKAIEWVKNEK